MSRVYKLFLFGLLLFVFGAGGWFFINPFNAVKLENDTTKSSLTLYDLTLREYSKEGKLEKKLITPKLENFKSKNISILTSPTITVMRGKIPWTITSQQATAYEDNKKILLRGNVAIREQANKKEDTSIHTQLLWYYPKAQIAKTNEDVTFKQLGVLIKSKGMYVNLKNEKLELLHHARGKYEPIHG